MKGVSSKISVFSTKCPFCVSITLFQLSKETMSVKVKRKFDRLPILSKVKVCYLKGILAAFKVENQLTMLLYGFENGWQEVLSIHNSY